MRQLIMKFDPSFWSEISAVIFCVCFMALVIWVYLPSRRKSQEASARLPLED